MPRPSASLLTPAEQALLDLSADAPPIAVPLSEDGTPADEAWERLVGDLGRALVVERGWQGVASTRTCWVAGLGVACDVALAGRRDPLQLRITAASGAPLLVPPAEDDPDALAVRMCALLGRHAPGPPRVRPADPLTGGLARVLTATGPATDDPSLIPSTGFREARPRLVPDGRGGRAVRWPWRTADAAGVVEVPVSREGLVPPPLLEAIRTATGALARAHQAAAERRRAEDRCALLQAAVDLSHDGFIAGTADGDLLLYSDRLSEISSWSRDEVDAHGWAPLAYPDPTYRAQVQEWIRGHFLGRQFDAKEVALTRRDGTRRACRLRTQLVPTSTGMPAVMASFQDVTPLEEAAREAARQDSLDALGRLAGTIAHDFRNLLAAVMGHANVLELSCEPDSPIAERARRIADAAERGDTLTRRLLSFGGARPAELGPVDLAAVVREALSLRRAATPDDILLEADITERLPPAHADAGLVGEALDNLLVNAVQASRPGPGRVMVSVRRVELPPGAAFVSPELHGEVLRIRVADSGSGFTEDARQHLFEPFWTSRREGHGIGLATVRSIAGLLGAGVDVPECDSGAWVDLLLPLSSAPAPRRPARDRALPRGDERLWVVDDDPALVELAETALSSLGYRVRGFESAEDALAAIDGGALPDLMLLDVMMPGMKGPELRDAMYARGHRTPVLFCTGLPPEGLPLDARTRVLEKPFTLRALARAVRSLLERHVLVPGRDRPR